ncbi:restriction endonuclease subunit S [uncultured Methanobrevibacter sp.]|uniref:restriction endonuclease subunit S n=1 Tax=uncultured Methanobrevibacter sp. TaxID=253161 RepID=UPI0025F2D043|nr:restriction endonuclease subunit S [uncultured Methanobrevibacter sp.]
MNEEKIVPKLRFSGFDDEWGEVKLGEIFDIKNGLNKGKEFFGKGIQILNYMDVNKHEFNTEKMIEGLVELTEDEIERFSVKPNDLFFTRTSETSDEIGLTSAYIGNEVNCVFSGFILRARPKIGLNSLFYAYYFRSPQQRNNIIKYSSITTRALISGANLSKMKIRLPPAEEQNNIAKFLQIIDKKIELLEKKHQYYQDFKKYLMQQIFAQKLRFDFHEEWRELSFKQLLKEINEKTTENNQHEILSSTKDGIFTQKEYFADRNVASKDNTGYKILRKNQIVLSPQNLWMGNINVNTEFDIGIVSPSYKIYETTDLILIILNMLLNFQD